MFVGGCNYYYDSLSAVTYVTCFRCGMSASRAGSWTRICHAHDASSPYCIFDSMNDHVNFRICGECMPYDKVAELMQAYATVFANNMSFNEFLRMSDVVK
jgi:hypothetical protein